LGTAEVQTFKVRVLLSLVFKPAGLILIAARDLLFVVEPLTLRQRGIVKSSVRLEHNPKFTLLVRVRPKAKLIGTKHKVISPFGFLCVYEPWLH
jgi:hypothetical protein